MEQIDIQYIDRRFEILRIKDTVREKALLSSIALEGIRSPIKGAKINSTLILIDGFKRLRSAIKLHIPSIPYLNIAHDEASALLDLIRLSAEHKLTTFEEAVMIEKLHKKYELAVSDIASKVEKSNAWVSVRLNILHEMSDTVKESLLNGTFPIRSYMYTLRHFTRVNSIPKKEIDRFVQIISGNNYSTRDIEILAHGYFRGGSTLKQQIENGNCNYTLRILKAKSIGVSNAINKINKIEQDTLRDLELFGKYMNRITCELPRSDLKSKVFFMNACNLIQGILDRIHNFISLLEKFYDKAKHTKHH